MSHRVSEEGLAINRDWHKREEEWHIDQGYRVPLNTRIALDLDDARTRIAELEAENKSLAEANYDYCTQAEQARATVDAQCLKSYEAGLRRAIEIVEVVYDKAEKADQESHEIFSSGYLDMSVIKPILDALRTEEARK